MLGYLDGGCYLSWDLDGLLIQCVVAVNVVLQVKWCGTLWFGFV